MKTCEKHLKGPVPDQGEMLVCYLPNWHHAAVETCFVASSPRSLGSYFFYFSLLSKRMTCLRWCSERQKKRILADNNLTLKQHIMLQRITIILSNSLFTGTAICQRNQFKKAMSHWCDNKQPH